MNDVRFLLLSNRSGLIPAAWMALLGLQYAWWYGSVGDQCVLPLQELFGVGFVIVASCLLSPGMASWWALSVGRPRLMQAIGALTVLGLAFASVFVVWLALRWVPNAWVPGGSGRDPAEVTLHQTVKLSANVVVVGGAASVFVALLGRPVGSGVACAAYVAIYWTARSVDSGYYRFCRITESAVSPIGPSLAVVFAFGAWFFTGGTTRVARRRLDPV